MPKKCIPSAKILCTEDLSNNNLKHLCENSPNSICHFWNHKSFFATQLLCIFLAQTLHIFYKNIPSKCKYLDFLLLVLKFTKFLISFFKQKTSCSSKFGLLFSVMRDNSSVLFSWNFYAIDKSNRSKCKFLDLPLLALKFTQFLMFIFGNRVFFPSYASLFGVIRYNSFVLFHLRLFLL